MDNVKFLYDIEIEKFLSKVDKNSIELLYQVERHFRRFLWFFDKNEPTLGLIGADIVQEKDGYAIYILFAKHLPIKFKVPWVNELGYLIGKHWKFYEQPFHVSYYDIINNFFMTPEEEEEWLK